MEKSWFKLTFEEKLYKVHRGVLFPETIDKNMSEFLSMLIQRLLDKTEGMTNDEIDKFFE